MADLSDAIQTGKFEFDDRCWCPLHDLILRVYFTESTKQVWDLHETDFLVRIYVLFAKNLCKSWKKWPNRFSMFLCN